MRGRKPKPTKTRVLHGTFRPDRANAGEPQPKPADLEPPAHLSGPAKEEWHRMGAALHPVGLLTELDVPAFEMYCESYARWAKAKDMVAEKGMCVVTSNGNIIQNPYLSIANKAQEQAIKIMVEFGMTQSSRTRVSARPPAGDDDSVEKMLFG